MDPDDLQAMIATREILDDYPEVDFVAVNGTKRVANASILTGSTQHMRTMFPDGLDAFANHNDTVSRVAAMWKITLDTNHKVFVAEGGPADFTANVIDRLRSQGVSNAKLKNITVVQHSHGWNENNTTANGLATVIKYANYVRIADGNNNNATPDFNSGTGDRAFRIRAETSLYKSQWSYAFSRISNKVDFSDAVEVMYILGLPKGHAATPAKFADRYF